MSNVKIVVYELNYVHLNLNRAINSIETVLRGRINIIISKAMKRLKKEAKRVKD
jgi:hypothetical protein